MPRDLRVPSRASCREGFEQGEAAKTLGFTLLASIEKVKVSGDRAEVRFWAKGEGPKKTSTTPALVIRRGGHWRVVLPCEVLGCDPMLLPARQARRPRPKILDERVGRYRGTTIGDRRSVPQASFFPAPSS